MAQPFQKRKSSGWVSRKRQAHGEMFLSQRKKLLDRRTSLLHEIGALQDRVAALERAGKLDDLHPKTSRTNREVFASSLEKKHKSLNRTEAHLKQFD